MDAGGLADLGEAGVFSQEAVTGMDGVGPGHLGRGQDGGRVEVALGGLGGSDTDALIGELGMEGRAVRLRIDGHGLQPQLVGAAEDAENVSRLAMSTLENIGRL
jgi:hypothetical protein